MFSTKLFPSGVLLLAGALAVFFAGCSSSIKKNIRPNLSLDAKAIFFYPFGFRWEEPTYRSIDFSQRLLNNELARYENKALFFGPAEFRVYRPEDDHAWAASNAVSLMPAYNLLPSQAVVIRPWAERRTQSGEKELADSKGRGLGRIVHEEALYLGHVEVLHPTSGEILAEMTGEVKIDPFSKPADEVTSDPLPDLTRLMETLVHEALSTLEGNFHPLSKVRRISLRYAYNPETPPEIARSDAIEQEILRSNEIQFSNPKLDTRQLAKLDRLPAGLVITEPSEMGRLKEGDVITGIEGQRALPQTAQRAQYIPHPRIPITVRRVSGLIEETAIP